MEYGEGKPTIRINRMLKQVEIELGKDEVFTARSLHSQLVALHEKFASVIFVIQAGGTGSFMVLARPHELDAVARELATWKFDYIVDAQPEAHPEVLVVDWLGQGIVEPNQPLTTTVVGQFLTGLKHHDVLRGKWTALFSGELIPSSSLTIAYCDSLLIAAQGIQAEMRPKYKPCIVSAEVAYSGSKRISVDVIRLIVTADVPTNFNLRGTKHLRGISEVTQRDERSFEATLTGQLWLRTPQGLLQDFLETGVIWRTALKLAKSTGHCHNDETFVMKLGDGHKLVRPTVIESDRNP